MIHDKKHLKYTAIPNEEMYWERVNRSLGWLGDTKQEQHNKQEKLKNVVIGIAGTGGIGGQLAQRLVRMGVRNLKLADPDTFDISNMNRQMGADLQHIGKNKAEVVAEMTYSLNHDVNIAVYPEGITKETAEDFVQDCDYVLDQMEFYEIANRYALHRAFRKSSKAKLIFKVPTVAHGTYIFKYTKDSMKIEDVYGIKEDSELSPKVIHRLMERIIPHMPKYPSKETLDYWFVDMHRMPIFAACPPIAEGVLAERLAQEITGLNKLPGAVEVPAQPGYVYFDTLNWTTEVKKGKWWTWMSLNGEKNTGVSCIEVTPEIDGGDIVLQRKVRLTGNENSLEVREKLFKASFSLFNDVLDLICQGPLKTHKQDMTKRDYHSNPSQEDKTITNNDTVSSALAKLKACAPGNAYVQINDNVFKVNSVSWSQTSKAKLKLKDGRLSFFLENTL